MDDRRKSLVYVALTQIIWPTNAAVPVLLLSKYSNTQLIFFNSLAGILLLLPIVLLQQKQAIVRSYAFDFRKLGQLVMMGMLGIVFYLSFLYQAYLLLSTQLAYTINLLWPVMTVLFSFLILKDKIQKRQVLGISIGFLGVLLVISKGDLQSFGVTNWGGVLVAYLAASSYGMYSVLGKKWDFDREVSMLFFYSTSAITTGVYLLVLGGFGSLSISAIDILGFLWVGGFILALGDLFWFLALKFGNTAELSTVVLIGPFLAFFWIYFLLGEPIALFSIIGMLVVVIGNYFSRYQNNNDQI